MITKQFLKSKPVCKATFVFPAELAPEAKGKFAVVSATPTSTNQNSWLEQMRAALAAQIEAPSSPAMDHPIGKAGTSIVANDPLSGARARDHCQPFA